MSKSIVAIVRYEKPLESVRKAVELSRRAAKYAGQCPRIY